MGSMHTGLEEGTYSLKGLKEMGAFFAERASVGLIVTGGIAPNTAGRVSPLAAKMTNKFESWRHRDVTRAVHEADGRIAMQILHSGRYGYHPFLVSASKIKSPIGWFRPSELDTDQVQRTIDDYARCASLAKEAGYDGVEIMGSEGYLINQFIAERTNVRTDEWGGTYANRIKFPERIVRAVREACGDDFIVIYRLSMLDLVEKGSSWDEIVELARAVENAGVSILNTGIGWHEARIPTIATQVPRGAFSFVTAKLRLGRSLEDWEHVSTYQRDGSPPSADDTIRGSVKVPLVTTNRINRPETAERILADGHADMVSMARPLLADPKWIPKAERDEANRINVCIGCNQACLDHTFVAKRASCLVNPRAGYELDPNLDAETPTQKKQRVAVVGAGPAGLAFATTASRRGHDVVLFDAAEEIGGQFNMAKRIPGKEEFYETLQYFGHEIESTGVDLRLNTRVQAEDLTTGEFDAVVLATGVRPRKLNIPGAHDAHEQVNVLYYDDVLARSASVGKRVAIVGAGGIGFDMCEFIAHDEDDRASIDTPSFLKRWGIDSNLNQRGGYDATNWKGPQIKNSRDAIYMLQRKRTKHGAGLGRTTGWIHRATAKAVGVEFVGGATYDRIDNDGLHITVESNSEKKENRTLNVDTVIICAGQESLFDLEKPLQDAGVTVHRIGGAAYAGELDAKRAIDMGTRLGVRLEHTKEGEASELGPPVGLGERLVRWAIEKRK